MQASRRVDGPLDCRHSMIEDDDAEELCGLPQAVVEPFPISFDGPTVLKEVQRRVAADIEIGRHKRAADDARAKAKSQKEKKFKPQLIESISFGRHFGAGVAAALERKAGWKGVRSGETPSRASRGLKRLDLNYSTPEMGLGLGMSFKSVHRGERAGGRAGFTHNKKRNDEELRVEATGHHLRQPYAVMVAVVILPFESCDDWRPRTDMSSFADWVQYFWPLKGRVETDDPPDKYELVFFCLYERDGRDLGFYEVGGLVPCPRKGRPKSLLSFDQFLDRVVAVYTRRNGMTFHFEGEEPV